MHQFLFQTSFVMPERPVILIPHFVFVIVPFFLLGVTIQGFEDKIKFWNTYKGVVRKEIGRLRHSTVNRMKAKFIQCTYHHHSAIMSNYKFYLFSACRATIFKLRLQKLSLQLKRDRPQDYLLNKRQGTHKSNKHS